LEAFCVGGGSLREMVIGLVIVGGRVFIGTERQRGYKKSSYLAGIFRKW
jgi:hypothetical protein